MVSAVCEKCGKPHGDYPAITYLKPKGYFKVPADERSNRITYDEDLCVIDGKEFFIRGVLQVPVIGSTDHIAWGVWAAVTKQHFFDYIKNCKNGNADNVSEFFGQLSGGIKTYPDTDGLLVKVHLRQANQRPLFIVASDLHPLSIARKKGVTQDEAHEIIESSFPDYYK